VITNDGHVSIEARIVDRDGTVIDRQQANVTALNYTRRRCSGYPTGCACGIGAMGWSRSQASNASMAAGRKMW
jgi:hypothetical protein